MTFGEVSRAIESYNRRLKTEEKRKASFDYTLADLIGRSVARIYNSSNSMPTIAEVYPSLFEVEEVEEAVAEKRDTLSALRFKQFAQAFNRKYKEVGKEE